MNNEAVASVLSALAGNGNAAQPATSFLGAVNYFGPGLAYRQADTAVKDLQKILDDVERNIMNNLTQVLRAAGIRM